MKGLKSAPRPTYRSLYQQAFGKSVKSSQKAWKKTKQKLDHATTPMSGSKGGRAHRERKENRLLDIELRNYSYR